MSLLAALLIIGLQTGHRTQRARRDRRGNHARLGGARFNKQENNLLTRYVSGSCKFSKSPGPVARILKVYVEALTGFCQV